MVIFRKASFYFSLLGLVVAILFIIKVISPKPASTPIANPSLNPFPKSIAASGIIEAEDRNLLIGTPESGLVERIFVQVGQKVKKGDVLFKIDTRELKATLDVQTSNINVARADLARLNDQLSRLEAIEDKRAVSIDELKTKRSDVLVAQAQLQAAKALAKQTQVLMQRLSVRAPKDGVILQINVRVGEYLSSLGVTPAIVLGDIERLQIRANIDEQNASSFVLGTKAVAYPKNNTTLVIPLTFSYVEPFVIPKKSLTGSSEERVDTRVLEVIYTLERPKDFKVYVGQQVDVFIELN